MLANAEDIAIRVLSGFDDAVSSRFGRKVHLDDRSTNKRACQQVFYFKSIADNSFIVGLSMKRNCRARH